MRNVGGARQTNALTNSRHKWLHAVFKAYGFPLGFRLFLEALLHHNFAVFGPDKKLLYIILAGIVQGCPAAGMCFAVGADLSSQ